MSVKSTCTFLENFMVDVSDFSINVPLIITKRFKEYCAKCSLLNSTVAIRCKHLASILDWINSAIGLEYNMEEIKRHLRVPTEDHKVEIIEPDLFFEIVDYCVEYGNLPYLTPDKVIFDFIVIASKTGARVGDILSWTKIVNFVDDRHLEYRQQKKRGYKDIRIPVDKDLARIFNHNDDLYGLLAGPYNQNALRLGIRRVLAHFPEMKEAYSRVRYCGKKRVVRSGERREFITPHTFRASLASAMLMKGVDRKTVMEITGHSPNSVAFARYENICEDHKNKMYTKFWKS